MNANEFANETMIPSEIFEPYIEWNGELQRYMVSQSIDPHNSDMQNVKSPLGSRNRLFLSSDRTLGKYILHMAGLESDLNRVSKASAEISEEYFKALGTISRVLIEQLSDSPGYTEKDINDLIEEINDALPWNRSLPKITTTYTVEFTASIEIDDIEFSFDVEASSEEEAKELASNNLSDYIDMSDILRSHVSFMSSYLNETSFNITANDASPAN